MEETKENVEKLKKGNKLEFLRNNKKIIIALVIILLILAIILTIFLVNRKRVKFKGESNGIKYSANITSDSELLVVMKNNTEKTVSKLTLNVAFYDANGNELTNSTKVTNVGCLKNDEISLEDIEPKIANVKDIADYKIEIVPDFYEGSEEKSKYEKIEIEKPNDEKDKVTVKVKNVSGNVVNRACFYAVYFKKGVPVGIDANDVIPLEKDGEKELSFEKPKDAEGKEIDYTFCKIYIKF